MNFVQSEPAKILDFPTDQEMVKCLLCEVEVPSMGKNVGVVCATCTKDLPKFCGYCGDPTDNTIYKGIILCDDCQDEVNKLLDQKAHEYDDRDEFYDSSDYTDMY
jgi:hypothetical protein